MADPAIETRAPVDPARRPDAESRLELIAGPDVLPEASPAVLATGRALSRPPPIRLTQLPTYLFVGHRQSRARLAARTLPRSRRRDGTLDVGGAPLR